VYESRSRASEAIRTEIRVQVNAARATDDEIIDFVAERFGGQVLLVPRSTGIEALAWALPVAALVVGVTALMFAFGRWRRQAATLASPTDDDIALVAEALAAEPE
jgi:cytochrome c-type biogenesis protein CcmH